MTKNTVIRMMRGLPVQGLTYYRTMTALRRTPPLDDEDAALPNLTVGQVLDRSAGGLHPQPDASRF